MMLVDAAAYQCFSKITRALLLSSLLAVWEEFRKTCITQNSANHIVIYIIHAMLAFFAKFTLNDRQFFRTRVQDTTQNNNIGLDL